MAGIGRPTQGTGHLSWDTISLIKRVYPKTKTFYNRHLKTSDVKYPTFYRAMAYEPVVASAVRIIEDVAQTLRSRHALGENDTTNALDLAVSIMSLSLKGHSDHRLAEKFKAQAIEDMKAFLAKYNEPLSEDS